MHDLRLSKNRIYIFTAHDEMQKSADMAYVFCQEPTFFWLTRIREPGWCAVINTYTGHHALLRPKREATKTLFDGSLSDKQVRTTANIDDIVDWSQREAYLQSLAKQYPEVYALDPNNERRSFDGVKNPAVQRLWGVLSGIFSEVHDCGDEIAQLRALKQDTEVAAIERAVSISRTGFTALKQQLQSASYEYELEAVLNSEFRRTGANGHAYDPIVASGGNACTLHYSTNNDALPKQGLVLIDAAAQVDGYAADITRTYAIGEPTARQKAVHAAVETAHYAIINLIKPGVSVKEYLYTVDEIMKDALEEVGLLTRRDDTATYRKYFPHAISHGLGLDVHESLGGYKEFRPGMVLTVEPGIYIPEEGIGVRIEDDILVTETGHKNLSKDLPTSL